MMRLRVLAGDVFSARGGALAMLQTLLAQSFVMVINLATGILTARLLGPTGRGEFAAASLWLLLPSLLAVAGLQSAIVYQARNAPEHRAAVGLAAAVAGTAAFVVMALISLWCLPALMHGYDPWVVALAQAAMLASVVNVWTVVVRQSLLAEKDFRAYNLFGSGCAAIYLVLLAGLALMDGLTPQSAIWSQVLGTVVILALGLWRLLRGWRGRPLRLGSSLRPLVAYSLRAAPTDLVAILAGNVDRLVLVALVTPAEFGLYAVAIAFARILGVLQASVSAVTLADLAGRPLKEIERFVHLTFRVLAIILLLGCGAVLLVDRSLLRIAYGADFVQAAPIFRVLLLEAALSCLGQVLLQAFLASGRPSVPSTAQVASFAVTAGGVLALAPMFGAIGAASALAFGAAVRLGLLLAGLKRIGLGLPRPLPGLDDLELLRERVRRRSQPVRSVEHAD